MICHLRNEKLNYLRMEWWQILLYVVSIALALYMIGFFYAFESLVTFKGKIKRRTMAISILLSEKRDVLLSMYKIADEKKMFDDDLTKDFTSQVRWLQTTKLKAGEIESSISTLSSLQKRLFLFSESDELKNDKDFTAYLEIVQDLDANYRRSAAIFNSDVVGYEYWRKTPLFRLWFYIFNFRQIKRLP